MPCAHSKDETCPRCAPEPATLDADAADAGAHLRSDTLVREVKATPAPLWVPELLTAGERIGRYVVLERLGQGGMGVVYTAHDPRLERLVAIKLLRSARGAGSTGGQVRLLREAQAMAQLSHPNVVPVYDVGAFRDGVFIAMELVKGDSLDVWVSKQKDWRQILAVYIAAGRGLQAAHEAGLVHRDFKPHNVLLGADRRPRITDFGIARSTRSTQTPDPSRPSATGPISLDIPVTRAGAMMGSPGYMAPEQYTGAETSHATDQFAFCVSLYEGLYGERPFKGKSLPEIQASTTSGAVPPPPKGSPVPPWVHRTLAKGLAADPVLRHPSMAALLDALSHDPDAARRRWLVGSAAAAVLVAGIGTLAWLSSHQARACRGAELKLESVWDAPVQAKAAAAFRATNKPFATRSWDGARDAMDGYSRRWTAARTEACEATRVRGEQTDAQMLLRLSCLDRRLDELGALAQAFANADGEVVMGASSAVSRLSPLEACANVKSLEDRRQPPAELRPTVERLEQQLAQGRALTAAGRFADARGKIEPAVAGSVSLGLPTLQAEAYSAAGELEQQTQHFPEARTQLERAVKAAEVAGDDPAAARALANMITLVGWRLERPEEARTLASFAAGILERIGGDTVTEAKLAEGLGDAEWQAGNRVESLAHYRRALALYVELQGEESVDVARQHSSIGWVLTELGQFTEARTSIERSKALREKLLGPQHPTLASTWNELANLSQEMGDSAEALRCSRRELEISEQGYGEGSLPLTRARVNLASQLIHEGRPDEAAPLVAAASRDIDAMADPTPSFRSNQRRIQVELAFAQGHAADAVKVGRAALVDAQRELGADHPDVADLSRSLAAPLDELGFHAEALELSQRYLRMKEKVGAQGSARYADALLQAAVALEGMGRLKEALEHRERAVAVLEAAKYDVRTLARGRLALADALWKTGGDKARARRLGSQAREAFAKLDRPPDVDKADAWLTAHPAR